jgi:DNA-binding XRE family transcriptional regulator
MISIDALGLSNRTRHLLSREQILTVEELVSSRANGKLASLRGMGPGTLHEIDEALASFSPVIDLKNQVSFERFVREEFKKITIKAKLELETGRLSDKVICDNACLDQCFVNDIDTTPFQSILDLKPIFDCALKSEDIHQELQDLLVDQSKREINVLLGRFGPNKRTLEDLAHNLNVTRERVRQIELGAEAKVVLAYQRNWLPRTQTAINIAKAYGNRFRYETWKNKLEGINLIGSKKLIINNERIDSIDTLRIMISIVRLLGRRNLNELFSLPDNFIEYVEKPSYSAQAMLDIKKISKKKNARFVE